MPLPLLAIPVLHSSGAWIASTAAAGYISGTLSSTWIGAFILGNASLLSATGLVSAAGIFGSSIAGGISAAGGVIATGTASALSAIGMGGVATKLGLAPATFLGLTPIGWGIIGTTSTVVGSILYFKLRKSLKLINEERFKGGLGATTWREIIREVKLFEKESFLEIIKLLAKERNDVNLSNDGKHVLINGVYFKTERLKYVVLDGGIEVIKLVPKLGKTKTVLVINGLPAPNLAE